LTFGPLLCVFRVQLLPVFYDDSDRGRHEAIDPQRARICPAHDVLITIGLRNYELSHKQKCDPNTKAQRPTVCRGITVDMHGGQARDLLAPVYGWFTEGFNTPDLTKAKSLLDQLA
jgi:hypothetical protein